MGLLIRGLWFVTVGWLLGLLWFVASVVLMGTIVFFPVGAYLAAKTWAIMTLKRKPQAVIVEAQAQREQPS